MNPSPSFWSPLFLMLSDVTKRLLMLTCVVCLLGGCRAGATTQTNSFEIAETAYKTGDYKSALDGYEGFLRAYPSSPLAQVARLRIRCIHREVRSLLGRTDTPRPMYRGQSPNATP